MALLVRTHCGYPSYAESGEPWNIWDWDAWKLVKALKGKPINGWATLRRLNGTWARITAEHPEAAFEIWGEWAAAQVAQTGLDGGWLIPVPSSDCLALGQDPKGLKLAEAVAGRLPGFDVYEGLHWHVQLPKASEGGPRDAATLFANLRIALNIPQRPIVLIDDVVTGGGHLRACAQGLRAFGHEVEHAVCAAQTVHTHPQTGMFAIPERDLEAPQLAFG